MSEEEKAIETLKEVASDDFDTLGDDISPKMAQNILNVINRQKIELDFYKKEELGYIVGYEDGKRHKQTAVAIKNENAQQELFQKEIARLKEIIKKQQKEIEEKTTIIMAGAEKVKQLEKEIQRLEKDNDTLSELVIVNEDKVIKELDLISKDKIKELKEKVEKEMISNPYDFSYMINKLLEEN